MWLPFLWLLSRDLWENTRQWNYHNSVIVWNLIKHLIEFIIHSTPIFYVYSSVCHDGRYLYSHLLLCSHDLHYIISILLLCLNQFPSCLFIILISIAQNCSFQVERRKIRKYQSIVTDNRLHQTISGVTVVVKRRHFNQSEVINVTCRAIIFKIYDESVTQLLSWTKYWNSERELSSKKIGKYVYDVQ